MKISDEELQQAIKGLPDIKVSDPVDFANIVFAVNALQELQQLREERRWRKVGEELPEAFPNVVQVEVWKPGMIRGVLMDIAVLLAAVKIGKFGESDIFEYYWRPLPMDLPEVE